MKIAVATRLLAKRKMKVNSGHLITNLGIGFLRVFSSNDSF